MAPPAPLIETEQARAPAGGEAFWHEGAGGVRLRAALFPAQAAGPGSARGSVVLSPGRTETIEKYYEVIGELQRRGFVVLVHDWRGQGLSDRLLSDRLKGHAEGLDDFLADYALMLDATADRLPRPWIALGHSMGGLMALALAGGEKRFGACLLSAPMAGVAAVPMPYAMAAVIVDGARLLGLDSAYMAQGAYDPMGGPFEHNVLTHDRTRYERNLGLLRACPDLALGGVTWGWLGFALKVAQAMSPAAAARIGVPITVVAAGDDRLVDNDRARRFALAAPKGRFIAVDGAFHELMMETDDKRAEFWRAFDALVHEV